MGQIATGILMCAPNQCKTRIGEVREGARTDLRAAGRNLLIMPGQHYVVTAYFELDELLPDLRLSSRKLVRMRVVPGWLA